MPSGSFCGLRPLLFGRKASRFEQVKSAHLPKSPAPKQKESKMERPRVSTGNFILMMELRKKIIIFRDVVDLPPREGSVSVNELVIGTLKDLHRFYPEIITRNQLSEMKRQTLNKVLFYFCEALKTIGDSWMMNSEWMDKATHSMYNNNEHHNSESIVEIALATLDCMIKIPKETFDRMDVDEEEDEDDRISYSPSNSAFNKLAARSYSGSPTSCCASPVTPTSVLPEYPGSPGLEAFTNISGSSPLLRSLRAQALGKLNPTDIKHLFFQTQSDVGSHVGSRVSQKNAAEDERQEEMEAKHESLHQRKNSGDEFMFEMTMEASTIPEMKEDENLENARSSTAKPDSAKVIAENPEATELLTGTPQVLPNAGAASSPGLIVSAEEIEAVGKSVPPPSTIIISQPNDIMQLRSSKSAPPPPPPPLPPTLIARQSEVPVHGTLPPPPPPVLVVSVASVTKSETQQPILQLNVTANGASLQMPPTSPELPMRSITVTTAAVLPTPPPPPPLPMKLGTLTTKPLPPPPPPAFPMQLGTSTIPSPPPPPPPMQLRSPQTTILKSSTPSFQLENLRMQPPPPPPPPPLQLSTMSKTPSIPPIPMQLGSHATLISQPPLPPPPPPPMQPRTITTMTVPPPPQMSMSAIAAPPPYTPPPPPPPMMSSKGTNAMVTLSSAPPPPPMISSNVPNATRGASPPPPPPMMSSNGAPPPPPPMMSSKGPSAIGGPPPSPTRPPPMMSSKGTMPPPPPIPFGNGAAAPPPPPPGATRPLRPKKVQTKLKRSTQIGNLYRVLKGKVEGVNQNYKSNNGRKGSAASCAGGKQGMADALAEMTKRSAYFQQIEEDVRLYTKSILELKTSISTFQTKDMSELIKFHSHVESILENLADETQVLGRFEGFPQKKLEALRMAAALYSKLNGVIIELHNWKIEAPLSQLLERTERYFCKIKGEMESLERTKDEESKKFQAHNIHFDFHIIVQIKEAMVDVSSNCMELALKERRDAAGTAETGQKPERKKACVKMLWKAFQFAFKVYSFAGGHDDRADKLTRELAHEIETDPQHQQ